MITTKILKDYFQVSKMDEKYLLYSLTVDGKISTKKYLCYLIKKDNKFVLQNGVEFKNIEQCLVEVYKFVEDLPYNSEYYNPMFASGIFEDNVISDYLQKIGFRYNNNYNNTDFYTFCKKDIYGKKILMTLSIDELRFKKDVKISICYTIEDGSWIELKDIEFNVDAIINAINNILKPLFLYNASMYLNLIKDMNLNTVCDVKGMTLTKGLNIEETELKEKIINQLETMLNKLKS